MTDNVVQGNFESAGFSVGDKRAAALHDWMVEMGRPATPEEMKTEMARLKRIMPAPEDIPSGGFKITSTPEWDALHAFDADNNVEPARTIAERIVSVYCSDPLVIDPLVDAVSHAIEDAMELGARRGPFEVAAKRS